MPTIYFGSDHAGLQLKKTLMAHVQTAGHKTVDLGAFAAEPPTDYPDIAHEVAEKVRENGGDVRGVLVCGSGIGMCMTANKHEGIRATISESEETVRLSRQHNNANVLCLGERILPVDKAKKMIDVFIQTPFEEHERHVRRVEKIDKK